jgi:beta-xylosidase
MKRYFSFPPHVAMLATVIFGLVLIAQFTLINTSLSAAHAVAPPTRHTPTKKQTYRNPVINSDFPDPDVIKANGTYYAYATNSGGRNIQVASSRDLVHWTQLPDALPTLPSWSSPGLTWAPSVIYFDHRFLMYYTTHSSGLQTQCVSVATSSNPAGPFSDTSQQPLVCQKSLGGTIDPAALVSQGKLYLYFKNDGNSIGITTTLWGQQLTTNGLQVKGQPVGLISNTQPWEGQVVEAPFMFVHASHYYLFFSANSYANSSYAEGYATCRGPLGPCQQASNNPILKSRSHPPVIGPAGASLIQIGQQTWIVYHKWSVNQDGSQGTIRVMCIDRVDWVHNKPVVLGPTTTMQPAP